MSDNAFDVFTRHAAGAVSRRGSLMALGGAGLATLAGPAIAGAGKAGEKAKKRANKKCKQQGGQCRTFFVEKACPGSPDPEECAEKAFRCCAFFGRCKVAAFVDCLFTP